MEGAWYSQHGGKARELYTILHFPYTSMVLSYVLIGAALAPSLFVDRLSLTLLAYFLGLGLSAHSLNELNARHWGNALTKADLTIIFILPLIGAISIGGYGIYDLYHASSWHIIPPCALLMLIVLETFFLFAYNTNWADGKFHNDLAFAFSWAVLPYATSYYVNSLTMTWGAVMVGLALGATAMIEINLSRWCKDFRRRSNLKEIRFEDDTHMSLSTIALIRNPEKALKLIVITVDLLAMGLLLKRMFG